MITHPIYNDTEEWKDIPGYEGLYQASSWGAIRAMHRTVPRRAKAKTNTFKQIVIRPCANDRGYLRLSLSRLGKSTSYRVNRLIALVWVPNPNNLPEVNHDDLVKENNHYKNLSWSTHLQNMQHAFANRTIRRYKNEENEASKKVAQFDAAGKLIMLWPSANETGRNGYSFTSVARACRGERKTYKGFIWKYAS